MICELRLLDETANEMLFHPLKNALIWLKCLVMAIPVLVINEYITPKSCYVMFGVLVVLIITLGILLHHTCKNKDGV